MKFDEVAEYVGDIPYIRPSKGKIIYDFIRKSKPEKCLELGFYHGSSSCYIAAAMQENGVGHLTTIDRTIALDLKPTIRELLDELNLDDYVTPIFAERSYNWELMKIIEKNSIGNSLEPIYDFCFIDGAHSWETDGFAFLLCSKLLKPGGWILFDDMSYRFKDTIEDQGEETSAYLSSLTDEEKNTAQVLKVFLLLVMQHLEFEESYIDGVWGWARKKETASGKLNNAQRNFIRNIYAKTLLWRIGANLRLYLRKAFRLLRN